VLLLRTPRAVPIDGGGGDRGGGGGGDGGGGGAGAAWQEGADRVLRVRVARCIVQRTVLYRPPCIASADDPGRAGQIKSLYDPVKKKWEKTLINVIVNKEVRHERLRKPTP
jgi:hypothetical protein